MNRSESELFCLADRVFFDLPDRLPDEATRFGPARGEAPTGWTRSESGLWSVLLPGGAALPEQGWKIHVAARVDDAATMIERVSPWCLERRVGFKFLRSPRAVLAANSKSAPRASSGKLVTIYPVDDEQFGQLVPALADVLAGTPSPYILSDLRIGAGPVFVRYGGFRPLECRDAAGALVPAIRRPSPCLAAILAISVRVCWRIVPVCR